MIHIGGAPTVNMVKYRDCGRLPNLCALAHVAPWPVQRSGTGEPRRRRM